MEWCLNTPWIVLGHWAKCMSCLVQDRCRSTFEVHYTWVCGDKPRMDIVHPLNDLRGVPTTVSLKENSKVTTKGCDITRDG